VGRQARQSESGRAACSREFRPHQPALRLVLPSATFAGALARLRAAWCAGVERTTRHACAGSDAAGLHPGASRSVAACREQGLLDPCRTKLPKSR